MTLSRVFRPVLPVVGALLLCFGGVLLGGCDSAGSKRASLYQRLTSEGPWTVEQLSSDEFDYKSKLEERYPQGVTITFRGGDGGQTYRVETPRSSDSTEVLAEGAVGLPGDNVLQMESFGQWTYEFEASRAVFSLQFGSQAVLRTLFSSGSRNENLEMKLAPGDD